VLGTLDDAARPGSTITSRTLLRQLDDLMLAVVRTLEGEVEVEVMTHLIQLRASITEGPDDDNLAAQAASVSAARQRLTELVNEYFDEKLAALPTIADYLRAVAEEQGA